MSVSQARVTAPADPSHGQVHPLGIDEVTITGGFWAQRQAVNGQATLAHIRRYLEREGWIANFDHAVTGGLPELRRGREFSDSEVYKYLEAVSWEIGRTGREDLEEDLRAVVARVGAAQEGDGYLNTHFGRAGQGARWSDLEWGHELYCLGHLFQAAVARERTRPGADDGLLAIAVKAADLVCRTFGEGGIESVCGHAEVETGLAELSRLTGNGRYLEQARLFIERRGTHVLSDIEWGRSYFQDDVPIREAQALRGHAVRANYLASGAVDVAVETSDADLLDRLASQWARTAARRTYITGGQGSRHQDEAFGDDWVLPNDRAYSETCAGVASIQHSWRLLLARSGAAYADLIERTLYNVVATSPSAEGTAFFYANTLYQRRPGVVADAESVSPRASSTLRAPWFEVSCCPPNVARTIASLASYLATTGGDGVQVHQFASCSVSTQLPDAAGTVAFDVTTEYPRDGRVVVTMTQAPGTPWTLSLRVPQWAAGARLSVNDEAAQEVPPGYAEVRREFRAGDVVTLDLPVAPRFTFPDHRIDATRGCVAVERGPEVLCVESHELAQAGVTGPGDDLTSIYVDTSVAPRETDDGVVVAIVGGEDVEAGWPYASVATPAREHIAPRDVTLVPYRSWGNRGPSTMRVWIPTRS